MATTHVIENGPHSTMPEAGDRVGRIRTPITRILQRLSPLELPAKEHFEDYLRFKWRANHSSKTIDSAFTSIRFFLDFFGKSGKTDLGQIERADLEAFIEHEQDRGMNISTVRTRMASIIAFLHFLLEQDLVPAAVFKKRIRLKLPQTLPRAMNPGDEKKLLSIIDHTRDRALILLLLRTGMRIGEAL